jgi:tetratricopeptide (TPR) repeat protein
LRLGRDCGLIFFMFRLVLIFILSAGTLCVLAQAPAAQPLATIQVKTDSSKDEKVKTGSEQEAFVIEQSLVVETYESDGTGATESTSRVRLQSQAGVQDFGLLTLPYQKNFQTAEFEYVRVRKPDGSVINTPLDDVQDIENEITRAAPFYSDLREKHIAVKGLSVGDVLEWRLLTHTTKAMVPGHFWSNYSFTKAAVVLDEQFRLSVPKAMYVNVKSKELQPQIHEEGARRIYEWKRSQPKRQEEDPKVKFGSPYKQPQPDVQISTFKSWNEVGAWYGSLQRDRVQPNDEVKAKALELTKSATTDDQKIRALYDFVATHFRYIGVAFGIGRYQPHAAADVLDNSYGDCKDKHTLLASLLQAVGIEAMPAIISSSHEIDLDVPSPSQFDHVITAIHRGKELLWLDTTAEVAPFGFLLVNLRDKQALVISADGSAAFVKTPENPPVEAFDKFQITGTLAESGELKASMQDEVRGDGEVMLRSAFHYVAEPQWKELMQRISYGMGFAGTVSEVAASAPEKTTEPFKLSYSYDRTDFPEWNTSKRITVPMPPMGIADLNDEYMKSGEPVRFGALNHAQYTSDVKLPEGYSIQVPENVDVTTSFAEYHSRYSLKDGTLHAERELKVLVKEVPASEYGKYREFAHKLSDDNGAWVIFTNAGTTPRSTFPIATGWPSPPDTDAGREFKDGLDLLQQRNIDGALEKLEEAGNRDPKLPGVWSAIGTIRFMRGDRDSALEDLRRQTRETPEIPIAFAGLARTLLYMHKPEEALPALRRWVELSPDDRNAISLFGNTLIGTKKYSEAVEVFEKAVKQDPRKDLYQFQLAHAYLEAGESDKALAGYKQAIELSLMKDDMQNDAAYELAEKSVHLDDAEAWARQAVTSLEQETQTLNLENLSDKSLRLMNQLSMDWDTLGWVYFQKAQYAKAESYLNASWWLRQNSVVAEHLSRLYQKLHQPVKASHFHQLSDATPDRNGEALTPEQAMRNLKSSWKRGEWDAHEQLGKMRTIHLPRVSPKSESAEFFVLFAAAPSSSSMPKQMTVVKLNEHGARSVPKIAVEGVKFVSGAESLKKATANLEHAQFGIDPPDGPAMKLLRRGILMCSPYTNGCDFTMITTDAVHSVN